MQYSVQLDIFISNPDMKKGAVLNKRKKRKKGHAANKIF